MIWRVTTLRSTKKEMLASNFHASRTFSWADAVLALATETRMTSAIARNVSDVMAVLLNPSRASHHCTPTGSKRVVGTWWLLGVSHEPQATPCICYSPLTRKALF